MSTRTDKLVEEIRAALTSAQAISAKCEEENRDFTDAERTEVTAKFNEASAKKKELVAAQADEKTKAKLAALGADLDADDEGGQKSRPANGRIVRGRKTIGQAFINSDEYKALLNSAPSGHFSKDHRVQTRPVMMDHILTDGAKTLVTGASETQAGSLVANDFLGLQVGTEPFQRPLMLRDLVTNGTTESDTVEYVRVNSVTNNAEPVPEATTTSNGTKPESGLATVKITTAVRTIAHWIPVTKRALSDASQIRTLIDGFLQYGLEEELEDQMISGDGTGENFTGLASVSGVQSQAYDTSLLKTLRKAKTKVRTVGRSIATGWALNPADVEALDLLTDGENRYYFGGPSGTLVNAGLGGPTTAPLWNLPVIETEGVPAGTGYVGDWRKCILWDREQASITMSDSHGNFFIQNLVAILAEMRAAFGVIQPTAFVAVDLTA